MSDSLNLFVVLFYIFFLFLSIYVKLSVLDLPLCNTACHYYVRLGIVAILLVAGWTWAWL